MNTKPPKRFDHLLRSALTHHANMVCHYNGARTAKRLFAKEAYRFAVDILAIRENYHNEFLDWVQTNKFDLDGWMDEHFEAIEQMGDSRQNLFKCIKEGMTETEYAEHFRMWGVKRRTTALSKPATAAHDAAKAVSPEMTDAERINYLTKQIDAKDSEIRQLKQDKSIAIEEAERYKKAFERAEAVIKRRKKTG